MFNKFTKTEGNSNIFGNNVNFHKMNLILIYCLMGTFIESIMNTDYKGVISVNASFPYTDSS